MGGLTWLLGALKQPASSFHPRQDERERRQSCSSDQAGQSGLPLPQSVDGGAAGQPTGTGPSAFGDGVGEDCHAGRYDRSLAYLAWPFVAYTAAWWKCWPPSQTARQPDQFFTTQAIPVDAVQTGRTLSLGDGASLQAVRLASTGTDLLLAWRSFRAMILAVPVEKDRANTIGDPLVSPVHVLVLSGDISKDMTL